MVSHDSDSVYSIDGVEYSLDNLVNYISTTSTTSSYINYSDTAFLLIKPYSQSVISTHKCKNKQEHKDLISRAKSLGLHLYYAGVENLNGRYYAVQPFIIDWDSISDTNDESKDIPDLTCPHCNKVCNSSSGLALHIKSRHSDDEVEAIDQDLNKFKCPYCDKIASSSSGKTLHIKNKHPEHFREYQEGNS